MSRLPLESILERLEGDGPINLFVSEDEYEHLKRFMCSLWKDGNWSKKDRLLTLAFFRGYTFYRELSEHDRAFWLTFHAELGLPRELPTPNQYDNLWNALNAHVAVQALLQYYGHRRAFVRTIDEVWGIRSLRAQQLVTFFIAYYREHPGKRITRELMTHILTDPDKAVLRQAASYDRVFHSMTRAVDFILENDLEGCSPDELEAHLEGAGIELGQPNALRFFSNKASNAVAIILNRLRLQRTPRQFQRYLTTVPTHLFILPNGHSQPAARLAQEASLAYGLYRDSSTGEEHHVTPAARISLSILERAPPQTYKDVAGLVVYVSPNAFDVQVGNRIERSTPIFLRRGKHHLWTGQLQQGVSLIAEGRPHPGAVGWRASTTTRLVWSQGEARLEGGILIDAFLPEHERDLSLQAGDRTFAVHPKGQAQGFSFELPRGELWARFEDLAAWRWPVQDRLFTGSGHEIVKTRLAYGPKLLFLVSEMRPSLKTPDAYAERLPGELPIWRITWRGETPLVLNRWRIDQPYRSFSYRLSSASSRPPQQRQDVTLHLHPDYVHEGEAIELRLEESLPIGTMLKLGDFNFSPHTHDFRIEGLPAGRYDGLLIHDGSVVGELEPFYILPPLRWELAQEPILIQGRTQVGRATLRDGRFETFRWKPLCAIGPCDVRQSPPRVTQRLEFDNGMRLAFDIEAHCFSVRFVNPRTKLPLDILRALHPNAVSLAVTNPYRDRNLPLRLRLASLPGETWPADELAELQPTARDTLSVEVCINQSSQTWVPVTRVPIHLKPVVSNFEVKAGFCCIRVTGPRDATLHLEIFEPLSGSTHDQAVDLKPNRLERVKLHHPEKLRPLHIRALVGAKSCKEGTVVLEQRSPPLLSLANALRRGLGWSAHRL